MRGKEKLNISGARAKEIALEVVAENQNPKDPVFSH
jgi:hypothetical protein